LSSIKTDNPDKPDKELIAIIQQNGFELDWQISEDKLDERQINFQQKLYNKFQINANDFLFFLGFSDKSLPMSDSIRFLYLVAASFIKSLSKSPDIELLREKITIKPETEVIIQILSNGPYINGIEYLNQDWIEDIWKRLNELFSKKIKSFTGSVADFFVSQHSHIHPAGRIFFHLVENKKDDEYPFAFLATYSSDIIDNGKAKHLPLKNALIEYKNNKKKLLELLSTVNKASKNSSFIANLVDSGDIFHPIKLTSDEAYTFLKEIPLYENAGILCRIPDWWKTKSSSLKLSINIGNNTPSHLGFDAIIDFDTKLSLGDETISIEELKKLLSETEGLAFIKGKWVEVDHKKLKETLKAYQKAQKIINNTDMNMIEAMRFQLNASKKMNISEESCELEINNGEWLKTVIAKLKHPDEIKPVSSGKNFQAILRKYQEKGVSWLYFMKKLGLGACLADDMGLGKTIQVIALLNYIRTYKNEKTLLLVPTSLVGNWMSEINKFTPSLASF